MKITSLCWVEDLEFYLLIKWSVEIQTHAFEKRRARNSQSTDYQNDYIGYIVTLINLSTHDSTLQIPVSSDTHSPF